MTTEARSSSKSLFAYLIIVTILGAFNFTYGEVTNENMKKLANANNIFALNLHKILCVGSQENVFFSPLGLSTVFGMLYYGVGGESAKELRHVLGYDAAGLPDNEIHPTFRQLLEQIPSHSYDHPRFANTILVSQHLSLCPKYKNDIEDIYQSLVKEVDFAKDGRKIVRGINGWVKEKTGRAIRRVLKDVSPKTAMLLLNAAYFKGKWKTAFHRLSTKREVFYNGGKEAASRRVRMMKHVSAILPYTATDDYEAVELPYAGDLLSMLVLLPKHKDGLPFLEQNLTCTMLEKIQQSMSPKELHVHFPKFKMEFSNSLPPELRRLGIDKIFRGGSEDFSGISANYSKKLSVTDVVHKAKIVINEVGVEAARTAMSSNILFLLPRSPKKINVFRADHPFVFFILDKKNGLIVFMGRVSKL